MKKYIDAIKIRAVEDNWRPSDLKTNQNLVKLCSELESLGISLPEFIDKREYSIPLTSNTLIFSKLYISLVEDCLNLYIPEIITVIENILIGILEIQMQHIKLSLTNSKNIQETIVIQKNSQYIHDVVIDRVLELYESVVGYPFVKLEILCKQLKFEPKYQLFTPQPAPRNSVTKYSTTDYI